MDISVWSTHIKIPYRAHPWLGNLMSKHLLLSRSWSLSCKCNQSRFRSQVRPCLPYVLWSWFEFGYWFGIIGAYYSLSMHLLSDHLHILLQTQAQPGCWWQRWPWPEPDEADAANVWRGRRWYEEDHCQVVVRVSGEEKEWRVGGRLGRVNIQYDIIINILKLIVNAVE